jgi:Glycine zipper
MRAREAAVLIPEKAIRPRERWRRSFSPSPQSRDQIIFRSVGKFPTAFLASLKKYFALRRSRCRIRMQKSCADWIFSQAHLGHRSCTASSPSPSRRSSDLSRQIFCKEENMRRIVITLAVLSLALGLFGCSTPLTTRETGAAVGAVGGAAAGGIIGSTVGHPAAGAAIGGALGLGAGALIGDQIQSLQQRQADLERQLRSSQAELDRQRQELEEIRKQSKEY